MNRTILSACIALSVFAALPAQTAPTSQSPAHSAADNALTLAGATLSISVDAATGQIRNMTDRLSGRDYCRLDDSRFGMIAGLRVKDMLSGQTFDDFSTPSTIKILDRQEGPTGKRLVFDKHFQDADFILRVELTLDDTCLQWDVHARKTAGPDRQIRLTYLLPLAGRNLWAPMNDPFVELNWEEPFQVRHGLFYGRSVQQEHRTALVPMVTLFERGRSLAYAIPADLPNVCVRFMNSADENSLFLLNSMNYPMDQRPHFKVVNDYLSLRDGKETRFSLLISPHKSPWRDALGWYSQRYSPWFQPDPKIRSHEGVYAITSPWDREPDEQKGLARLAQRAQRGVKWMELHGHFPWYGLYVNPTDGWNGHHESGPLTFDKVRRYIDAAKQHGIAMHIYYNTIDGQIPYVKEHFPESIARDENDQIIRAYTDCYLMNADPSTPFGRHCLDQFAKLLDTYPNIDGIFYDVYGRYYNIDFAQDDGLTMVNNKPAYCLKFAFHRIMDRIDPLARAKGKVFSANKPEALELLRGIDYIMADEGSDEDRLAAMQYYGLYKPIIILDGGIATRAESDFKKCLRYGMIYNDLDPDRELRERDATDLMRRQARQALDAYGPLFTWLVGKTWVLQGDPLELPAGFDGNIFRRPNGDYVVTLVSKDRSLFDDTPPRKDLKVTLRLPNNDAIRAAELYAADWQGPKPAAIDHGADKAAATGPDPDKWKEEEAVTRDKPRATAVAKDTFVVHLDELKTAGVLVLKKTE